MIIRFFKLIILILCFLPCISSATIALEGSDTTSGVSLSILASPTFAGTNRVWVAIFAEETSGHAIVDSFSFGYRGDQPSEALRNGTTVAVADSISTGDAGCIGIGYINDDQITLRNSDTVRVWTSGSSSATKMFLWTGLFSGVDQDTLAYDSVHNFTTTSTPNPLTKSITRNANGICIGGYMEGSGSSWTWNNSFTEATDFLYNGASMTVGYLLTTTGSSSTFSATASGPNRIAMVGLSFSDATAGDNSVSIFDWTGQTWINYSAATTNYSADDSIFVKYNSFTSAYDWGLFKFANNLSDSIATSATVSKCYLRYYIRRISPSLPVVTIYSICKPFDVSSATYNRWYDSTTKPWEWGTAGLGTGTSCADCYNTTDNGGTDANGTAVTHSSTTTGWLTMALDTCNCNDWVQQRDSLNGFYLKVGIFTDMTIASDSTATLKLVWTDVASASTGPPDYRHGPDGVGQRHGPDGVSKRHGPQ